MSRRNAIEIESESNRRTTHYGLEGVDVQMAGLDRTNGEHMDASAEYGCLKCSRGLDPQEIDGDVIYAALTDGSVDCPRGGKHDAAYRPLSWANSAALRFDEGTDSVKLLLSVSDPRGAFVMEVRRWVDGEGVPHLYMHVPTPDDSMPHAPLREIHPGTYEIG